MTLAAMSSPTVKQCCLIENNERCHKVAGNANYNKRIQESVAQQNLPLTFDKECSHNYICEHHKNLIMKERTKRKRRDCGSDDEMLGDQYDQHDDRSSPQPQIDLNGLQMNTLKRLKRHYKIPARPGQNKSQLAEMLLKYFQTIHVEEKECLTYFICMVKTRRSKFDQTGSAHNHHHAGHAVAPASPDV